MFVKIYAILSLLIEGCLCLFTDIIGGWADVWVPFALFFGLFIGFVVLHVLFLCVTTPFLITKKPREKVNRFCKFMVDYTVQSILLILRVKVKTSGIEKLPTDKRFLLVSNHRSGFDPMVKIAELMEYNIAYVSKPENFKIPLVGQYMPQCLYMTIDRDNARNAMKTLHRATDLVKNDLVSIGIYPEGTRTRTGELLEFKDGVFYVAKKAPCPVVVVTVKGTENILKNFPFKKTQVEFDVLDVMQPSDFAEKTTHDISEECREIMLKHLGK